MDALEMAQTQDTDRHFYIARQLEIARRDLEVVKQNMSSFNFSIKILEDALLAIESAEVAHRS